MVTEPIIMPFRALLDRVSAFRGMMFDIPFLCAFVALTVLERILYSLLRF